MKAKVLGICGSIRSGYKYIEALEGCVRQSQGFDDLSLNIKSSKIKFSNSDIAVAYAMLGAVSAGVSFRMISINNIFEKKHVNIFNNSETCDYKDMEEIDMLHVNKDQFKGLMSQVRDSDGIVLGTPVYFGDRSSVANKFLQLTNKIKSLHGKAFGVVSVGAKRNGGQETANIYSLFEGLMQNCIAVGNGPDTAQYGGTVVGGDKGSALHDNLGLKTCYGTGYRVAKLSSILFKGRKAYNKNHSVKLTVVMTMDTIKGEYFDLVRDYFNKELANEEVELNFVDLVSQTIYRCVSCDICPSPRHLQKNKSKKNPYNCIVQVKMDSMKEIQRKIVDSDAVVLAGVNSQSDLIYRYQAFMERTRYIRRGDFELTNKVVLSLVINNIGSSNNSIHALKVLTSFIRHNMFVTKPIEITKNKGEVIHQDSICEQMEAIRAITLGRQLMVSDVVCYKATGYSNCELDHTSKSRK